MTPTPPRTAAPAPGAGTTAGRAEDADAVPEWRPRGHIVAWTATALAMTIGLLLASVAFGLVTPRVHGGSWGWGTLAPGSNLVYADLRVTNDAWASTEVVGGGESLPGLRLVAATATTGDGTVLPDPDAVVSGLARDEPAGPDRPLRLGAGDTATLVLVWQVTDCTLVPADPEPIPLRLRTPLGLNRTVDGPDELGFDAPWTADLARPVCDPDDGDGAPAGS